MTERWLDELRSEQVDPDPRPGFKDELRGVLEAEWDGDAYAAPSARPHRRRWWAAGAAAAAIAVLLVGLATVTRPDEAVTPGTTDDNPPATATTSAPTVSVAPTTAVGPVGSVEPTTSDATVTTTPSPSTTAAATTSLMAGVPSLLAGWPPPSSAPVSVDDAPTLLPAEQPPGTGAPVRFENAGDVVGYSGYVQTFYDTANDAFLTVRTSVDRPPTTAEEFRAERLDTSTWTAPWDDAYFVESSADRVLLELVAPNGVVQLGSLGLSRDDVVAIARGLRRRPLPEPGWDLTALPAQLVPFAESGDRAGAARSLVWMTGAGSPVAELRITTQDAEALTLGWSEDTDAEPIDLGGVPGVVITTGGRVDIAWTTPGGAQVLFGLQGDRVTAERIARSIHSVDRATWLAASRQADPDQDGCQGLFC